MDNHQMMLFHLTQQMTQDKALTIARGYALPAATIDEIERKNPGMVLVRALEQRLIICKDVKELKKFRDLLKSMNLDDLAKIIEDSYVELKEVQSPPPQNVHQTTSRTPAGETTDGGNVVMSPLSTQAPSGTNDQQANTPQSPLSQNVHQPTPQTPAGETTDRGYAVMPPSSMQDTKKKIFISFSFKILDKVTALKDRIEEHTGKDSCWICTTGVRAGDNLDGEIIQAITNADIILCMINKDFVNSKECEAEVLYSRSLKKQFIPILLEKVEWPLKETNEKSSSMGLAFAQLLYVNLHDQTKKEEEFKKMISSIKEKLGFREQAQHSSAKPGETTASGNAVMEPSGN